MQNDANKPAGQDKRSAAERKERFRLTLRHAWHKIIENLPHKVLAVVIAVVLWAGLISQDPNLTREKTFNDVTITVNGSDAMRRSGYIVVSGLEAEALTATMTAEVPQTQYQAASASSYNPRIDLTRIASAGEQTLTVQTTSTSYYGSVESISPSTVTLQVDEYVTRYRIPVTLKTTGELPEGWWSTAPLADPQMVVISGPASLVEKVVRAVASIDLTRLELAEGSVSTTVPFVLQDADGRTVESSLIQVTSESVLLDTVLVSQTLYPTKKIALSELGLTHGKPADGYGITGVTASPAEITVAGTQAFLDGLETVYVSGAADVSGASEGLQAEIRLRRPSGAVYMSADNATVSVNIEPLIMIRSFGGTRITMKNIAAGLNAALDVKTATISVTGEQNLVSTLRSSQISAEVDLAGITEPGTYDLPVNAVISGGDAAQTLFTEPETVTVTLTAK